MSGDAERLRREQEERLMSAWAAPKGWRYWSAVNNTEVGRWYICVSFAFFLFAGVLALPDRGRAMGAAARRRMQALHTEEARGRAVEEFLVRVRRMPPA